MTPIRNVTDRERDLTAERDEYKAHAQLLQTLLMKRTAERDALQADGEMLDWLGRQGEGRKWIARDSITQRGYRLHQSADAIHATPREAIRAAMKEGGK